jgi:hypothetical protein
MKTKYGKAVQWRDGEAELTGVLVLVGEQYVSAFGLRFEDQLDKYSRILVAHSYTRELEFIEFGKLSDYPASPIPEPTK